MWLFKTMSKIKIMLLFVCIKLVLSGDDHVFKYISTYPEKKDYTGLYSIELECTVEDGPLSMYSWYRLKDSNHEKLEEKPYLATSGKTLSLNKTLENGDNGSDFYCLKENRTDDIVIKEIVKWLQVSFDHTIPVPTTEATTPTVPTTPTISTLPTTSTIPPDTTVTTVPTDTTDTPDTNDHNDVPLPSWMVGILAGVILLLIATVVIIVFMVKNGRQTNEELAMVTRPAEETPTEHFYEELVNKGADVEDENEHCYEELDKSKAVDEKKTQINDAEGHSSRAVDNIYHSS